MHKGMQALQSELSNQLNKQRFNSIEVGKPVLNVIVNNSLKEKTSVIGIGQCGSNLADLFNQNGFTSIIINSSKEDLKTIDSINKYHIKNGEGAGKERKIAKKLLRDDSENILSFIENNIKNKEVVLMCCSSAGGTGSGILPSVAKKLIYDNKELIVCPVIAIPNNDDCFHSKLNSYEFFQELSEIKGLGTTFVINNNKSEDYTYLNSTFYNLFLELITIPDYQTDKGNIDTSELKKILGAKEITLISSIDYSDKIDSSDVLVDIKELNISTLENDKKIKYIAISRPENSSLDIKKILKDLKKEFGEYPKSVFQGYNNKNKLITVLSGLSLPEQHINNYFEEVQANAENVKNNFSKKERFQKLDIDFNDEDDDDDEDDFFD